jgi:hypothetical protein
MKKVVSLFIVVLLILTTTSSVLASNYRETALDYLKEKYEVPLERIELSEGFITELQFTGVSFWVARYTIVPKGTTPEGVVKGKETPPSSSEPGIIPKPSDSITGSERGEAKPLPAPDIYYDGMIFGIVHISIKTGAIIEDEIVKGYYEAEWRLAEREWEKLRQEAGKLDVSLFSRIKGLPGNEKIHVWVMAKPVVTEEIIEKFEELLKKYPEQTQGFDISIMINEGFGYDLPYNRGGGVSSSMGIYGGVKEAITDSSPATDGGRAPIEKPLVELSPISEEYWKLYDEMWRELEKLKHEAVTPSLNKIKSALNEMELTYTEYNVALAVELTVSQLKDLAELEEVLAVFEYGIYTIMDGSIDASFRIGAPNEKHEAAAYSESGDRNSTNNPLAIIVLVAVMIFGASIAIYRVRISKA